jgi:signal transduction histidine kinase
MNQNEIEATAFFGKITAGVTHEIKNVLAIIKESAGLMQDILAMAEDGSLPHRDKFDHALSTIEDQTNRGGDLVAQLNRFAHTPDQPVAKIDLYELTKQIVSLSLRFARLKEVSLTISPLEQSLTLETRPVELQMAVFGCLECCLRQMPPGGHIDVHLEGKDDVIVFRATCEGDFSGRPEFSNAVVSSEEWAALQKITADLGGSVALDNTAPIIIVSLPMNE